LAAPALATSLCLLLLTCVFTTPARASRASAAQDGASHIELLSDAPGRTVLRFTADDGGGELTTLVRVPDTGRVDAAVTDLVFTQRGGEALATESGAGIAYAPTSVGDELLKVSDPAIMRDLRLVRVTFRPQKLPAAAASVSATVAVTTSTGRGANERTTPDRPHSPAFRRLYEASVINYASDESDARTLAADRGRELTGSRYIVITDPTLASEADSLLAWKEAKGLLPVLVTPPSGVWTRYELKQFIDNAYTTWDVPPEFVLLLGDTELVPTGGGTPKSDNFFAHVDGDDYLLDILVGRLPAQNASECRTMIAKTMSYDRPWIHGDDDWPMSALLLLREDGDASDDVYYANTWFAYDLMEAAGYSPIDTLFQGQYVTANRVVESLSDGKGMVNYRGVAGDYWAEPFSIWPGNVECGWKLSVVVSATCLTGNYYEDVAIGEAFLRAGNEIEPRGAAAFFGTSTFGAGYDLTLKRSYVDEGFFAGAFGPGRTLGEACAAAKLNLFTHLDDREEYEGWNLLGDPELSLWTAERSMLDVEHETIIALSTETLSVAVTSDGQPVEGAEVTLDGMPEIFAGGVTGADGVAELPLSLVSPCTLRLTAVAKNAPPFESSVRVLPNGPFVTVAERTVGDGGGGNGDGLASPGESVRVSIALTNLGDQTAGNVVARLNCPDPHATAVDSLAHFGGIEPDSTAWGASDFLVAIEEDWGGGYDLPLNLTMTYGDSVSTVALPPLETVSGDLVLSQVVGDDGDPGGDGDGLLEPGEVVGLQVVLDCAATGGLTDITGSLCSRSPDVTVTSATSAFPDAASGSQSDNGGAPFVVSVAPDAPPGDARLFLRVDADAPTYAYAETLYLDVEVAELAPLHPTGPDAYGYYAYDSSDTLYAAAPRYEWAEIGQPGPGLRLDDVSDASDGVAELVAPFDIYMYGLLRQNLWVSSNGFVSVYAPNGSWRVNSDIPSLDGPAGMFAPFWDDLDPSAGGDVYAWFDPYEHRYIIQYDEVRHSGSAETETFQVIIYDPVHYPTPTGDAPIAFLYQSVGDAGGCTVGIENPYQTVGTRFLFDGDYGAYAAPLSDGLAVLFTTAQPETLRFPWLVLDGFTLDDTDGGDGDGRPEPGEEVSLAVDLRNDGPVTATGIELSLSEDAPGVTVVDGESPLTDISPGSTAGNAGDPFVLRVADVVSDSLATLWLRPGAGSNARQGAVRLDLHLATGQAGPARLLLAPCHPNPFGDGTSVSFTMPASGRSVVRVYDVAGRLVRTVDDSFREPGPHEVLWDGRDAGGESVACGVYFVRLEASGESRTRKVVLLR
jgi:hypothetical protein